MVDFPRIGDPLKAANPFDRAYAATLQHILDHGHWSDNRTGVRTKKVAGYTARYPLSAGFPLLTTKKMHVRSIFHELLWFLKGSTNTGYLKDNGVTIWDEWADKDGNLGPVYGKQWRKWSGEFSFHDELPPEGEPWVPLPSGRNPPQYGYQKPIDQIANMVRDLRENPDSRRIIVSAWNPADVPKMALPSCHAFFQVLTRTITADERDMVAHRMGVPFMYADENNVPTRALTLILYQRSCDTFLGVPFNVASYAALAEMLAHVTNMVTEDFVHMYGDLHIYENHIDQVQEQLRRTREGPHYPTPYLTFRERAIREIDDFVYEDFIVNRYDSHPTLKGDVAV